MRNFLIALSILTVSAVPTAQAQVSFSITTPGISIGINVPAYPRLVAVPGYPVYYAPGLNLNYFFYDGLYWVFVDDNWYVSTWYNGPWRLVPAVEVPVVVLHVPVRYYRQPPPYFRGWRPDAAPHWGEHWGPDWQRQRGDWQRWNRRAAPPPAPLPYYQRQYRGDRYPHSVEQQQSIQSRNYRYQPRENVARQHFPPQGRPNHGRGNKKGD